MKRHLKNIIFLLTVFCNIQLQAQFYNGMQMEFGKNRQQFRDYIWSYYNHERFEIYFYEGGKDLANYVTVSAQKNLDDIQRLLDFPMEEKLQFVIYNKLSEFKQSNIGSTYDEASNTGGMMRIVGNKVAIYFDGDHSKMDVLIRQGIGEVIFNNLMYGGGVKDAVRSSTLLVLPDWFTKGLFSYCGVKWNTEIDNKVKDAVVTGKYRKFNRLIGDEAIVAGHLLWRYVTETYGESVIPNILYMTKVSRNLDNAFLFVLGVSAKNIMRDALDSYGMKYDEAEKYKNDTQQPTLLKNKKIKSSRVYSRAKMSSDGKTIAYTTNELGQYKVFLYDTDRKKSKRILKGDHKIERTNDYSYPIIAWHPSGKLLSVLIEKKGKILLRTYTPEDKQWQERRIFDFDKILDFSYSDDGKSFAMSAVKKGQSDIYVFSIAANGFQQITNDIYDDLNPSFVNGSKEIIFSSNRLDDSLKTEGKPREIKVLSANKDLWVYNFAKRSNVLKRLTNTPNVNETNPIAYDSVRYAYLSDNNGIQNRYIAYFDSVIDFVDTAAHYRYEVNSLAASNYSRSILEHNINTKSNKYCEVIYRNGKYLIYSGDVIKASDIKPVDLINTPFRKDAIRTEKPSTENTTPVATKSYPVIQIEVKKRPINTSDSTYIDITNYKFETEKGKEISTGEIKPNSIDTTTITTNNQGPDIKPLSQRNYFVNFATDYVMVQFDNSLLNEGYQKFTGGSPSYNNPGLNGFLKVSLSDVLEDYRIIGSMRIPTRMRFPLNENSTEYYLGVENKYGNLDKKLILYRQTMHDLIGFTGRVNVYTHQARYFIKYPLSEVASIRGSIGFRNDKTVSQASDEFNLKQKNANDNWAFLKAEHVFDNTRNRGLNLYNGFRSKIFGEYYKQVDKAETNTFVLGLDARHYLKIHREIIWANRLAGSASFGDQKLIYYLGAVDNWFRVSGKPRFDYTISIDETQNYAFQTTATNVRGFLQNIRNGSNFAVINSEIRWPFFRYLFNRPLKSDFFNNFQLIAFGDIGTAWNGWNPLSEENLINKQFLNGNPISAVLYTQKEPIVGGYGYGVRSRLLGYFVRLDWAYGVEDRTVRPRIFYFSLGLDF